MQAQLGFARVGKAFGFEGSNQFFVDRAANLIAFDSGEHFMPLFQLKLIAEPLALARQQGLLLFAQGFLLMSRADLQVLLPEFEIGQHHPLWVDTDVKQMPGVHRLLAWIGKVQVNVVFDVGELQSERNGSIF